MQVWPLEGQTPSQKRNCCQLLIQPWKWRHLNSNSGAWIRTRSLCLSLKWREPLVLSCSQDPQQWSSWWSSRHWEHWPDLHLKAPIFKPHHSSLQFELSSRSPNSLEHPLPSKLYKQHGILGLGLCEPPSWQVHPPQWNVKACFRLKDSF